MVEYHDVEVYLIRPWKALYTKEGLEYNGTFFAVFFTPLDFSYNRFFIDSGIGYFFREYPTQRGNRLNFTLQMGYMITDNIGISYSHISNGFGYFNERNPGLDNLSLVISL